MSLEKYQSKFVKTSSVGNSTMLTLEQVNYIIYMYFIQ